MRRGEDRHDVLKEKRLIVKMELEGIGLSRVEL